MIEYLEDPKGKHIRLRDYGCVPRRYFCSIAMTSHNLNEYYSYIMMFGIREESSGTIEPTDKVIEKISLVKVDQWCGKAAISYIASKAEEIIEHHKYTSQRTKIGVALNDYGRALIERLKKRYSNKLYQEPESKECGIALDNIKGLLQDLEEVNPKTLFFPNERIDIFKMAALQGKDIKPEKYEAYILALAGACRMFKNRPPKMPSVAPKWGSE